MKAHVRVLSILLFLPVAQALASDHHFNFSSEQIEIREIASIDIPLRLISSLDHHGNSVELDDGAIWTIVGSDSQVVASKWRLNDSVVVHPTLFPMLTGSQFYLYNERTHTTANANLTANPYVDVPTQIQINYIDYVRGNLQLVDGSGRTIYIKVNPKSYTEFSRWRVGHTLIIGSNEDCYAGWFSNYPLILINAERKNHGYVEAIIE